MDRAFQNRLERIQKLPTLPLVIRKLDEAVQDPDSDVSKITGIIQDDPAIMARILKVANSVFYTTHKRITDLRTAVVVMGLRAVHNIALSTAVFSTFPPSKGTKMDRAAFWRHSIYTAVATEVLSAHSAAGEGSSHRRDELHLAGLMHDIGKIVLEQFFHGEFTRALELSRREEIPLYRAEERILGANHTQVGAWLGDKWNLAPEILEAIRWHHHPDKAEPDLRHLVWLCHVANHMVNSEELGSGGDFGSCANETAFFQLGISSETAPDILESIRTESNNSQVLLEMVAQEGEREKVPARAAKR